MLKRSSTPVRVAGSLNVGKMGHVATSAQSWSISSLLSLPVRFNNHRPPWIVARIRRSWGVAAGGARSRAGNNGATRGVHATPVLSEGTPGALLNTLLDDERHRWRWPPPFLTAFEVVPYIGENATLGRSRLKAVIICGIRHPSLPSPPFCLLLRASFSPFCPFSAATALYFEIASIRHPMPPSLSLPSVFHSPRGSFCLNCEYRAFLSTSI